MMKSVLIAMLFAFAGFAQADEATKLKNNKYSEVVVSKKKTKAGTELNFKINIGKGIKYNFDGPWKLKLTADGMKKVNQGTSDFNKDQGLFKAEVPSSVKKVDYRVTTFICTKDGKRCFREVHKASYSI